MMQIFTDLGTPIVVHDIQRSFHPPIPHTTQSASPELLQQYHDTVDQFTAGL
jgi:hypothetical protein